ncbi:hypothetical protein R3P38DRAFT_3259211 [Favolaschia claudopus]|uniref:MYND-type domain-containing protein n=1 Tax=Favolaschia claudopus TaxID=2862362 RepID=A0AAW0D412_9AGAR
MHPLLQRNRLRQLPISSRRLTAPMLVDYPGYPSRAEISRFSGAAIALETPADFFPIAHHLLDPIRIPQAENLEDWTEESACKCNTRAALISYLIVIRTNPPLGAGIEFWPRIVPWVHFFLDNYRFLQTSANLGLLRPDEFYLTLMSFWRCISAEHPPGRNMSLMLSTPGSRVLAVRAWYSRAEKDLVLEDQFAMLVRDVITHGEGISLDEVIEGSDGDLDNFAKLIIRQCDPLIHRHSRSHNPLTTETRLRIFRLVANTVAYNHVDRFEGGHIGTSNSLPLCAALIRLGYIKKLTMAMYAFCELPRTLRRDYTSSEWIFLKASVCLLDDLLRTRRAGHELQSSLEAGLLDVLLCCAQADASDTIHEGLLCPIFADFLIPSTVYRGVLSAMGLAESKTTVHRVIHNDETKKVWTRFTEILARRLAVLNLFDAPGRITQRACDNVECTIIRPKRNLRRCSGCLSAFYCSRECQSAHWNAGHREGCSWHGRYTKTLRLMCTPKEHAFLRFLLRHDWQSHGAAVAADYANTQILDPQATLVAFCNYEHHEFMIQHFDIGGLQIDKEIEDHMFGPVARGGGRTALVIMSLNGGNKSWTMVLPVRRASPEIPEALNAIVALGHSLTEAQVQEQVEEVMGRESPNDLIV